MARWNSSNRRAWGSWQDSWNEGDEWTKDKSYRNDGYGRGGGGRGSHWRGRGQQRETAVLGEQNMGSVTSTSSPSQLSFAAQELARLQISFCPDPGRGGFTATYDSDPTASACGSVNAGSGRSLRVGGSGLNGQFAKDLASAGQPVDEFQHVHSAMMRLACSNPGQLQEGPPEVVRRHRGLAGCFARAANSNGNGLVIVDILKEGLRPLHLANVAMVYCVGPDRREYADDESFLRDLTVLGESLSRTCGLYNDFAGAAKDTALPLLQRLRVGLVSGGKYAGRVAKPIVAGSLLEGLARGALGVAPQSEDLAGSKLEFEFAYDEGVFEKAWQSLCSAATTTVESPVSDVSAQQ